MEQSAQNPMQGLPHGSNHNSIPPEFWNTLDANYPDSDQQLQQPAQHHHELPSNQTPLGIDWDHPVFQQQQRELVARPDPSHGIYSSLHQPWQQTNPLQQPPQSQRGYGASPQYQIPPSQFQQGQINFDARPLNASESSAFPQYSYPPNYFPQQPISVSDTFPEQHTQQRLQPRMQQQSRSPISSYPLPQGYSSEMLQNTIDLTNEYPDSDPNVTVNPQFLNDTQAFSQQQPSLANAFVQGIPQDFSRPGGEQLFDYYQNHIQTQHQLTPSGNQANLPRGLQVPQVVIKNKKLAPKTKQTIKSTTRGPKKTASKSDSESSDESELEIEAPDEPSPIPLTRPTDPEAAAQYDTLQAVWSPRNKWPGPEKVKNALVAYKDLIKALRDAWKEQVQAMKLAENQGDNDQALKLKNQVTLQRRMMDKIAMTTLEMGHPNIVEKLGEHPLVVAALYSFLLDRFQATDFAGTLTINLLKLFARFSSLSEDLMAKTNLSKLLPKFLKKGGQQVKDLTQKILDNAAASTKRKQENEKTSKDEPPQTKGNSADTAGLKRPRETDASVQSGPKRMAVTSNLKEANKTAPGPTKGAPMSKLAGAAALRPKANVVAPKPSSLFGTLSSASKRPGTTNAERAAAAAAAKLNPASEKEKASAPKSSFSFGDLMADLNKPKEAPAPKPTEDHPPETDDERKKRLRKEERRKLRVTWKPDANLTEVRLFTHDPEEELGPGDGSMRSLGDVKGEGSVLKLHKDLEELEEEDLGGIRETVFLENYNLSMIDYDFEQPMDGNFIKRGGPQVPTSPEKEAQDHREATTLMVFYTSPADMPDTPKEPLGPDPDEVVPEVVPFGELPDFVKARQERYYSYLNPKPAVAQQPQQSDPAGNGFDIANLLKIIQGGQPQPITQQAPQHSTGPSLEQTLNMFHQQQYQPQPIPPAPPVSAPQPQGIDFNAILNVMKQMQTPAAFPQTQPQPGMAPNLGAMFSQFAGQNQQPTAPQYQHQNYEYEDPERKRARDGGHHDEFDPGWSRSKRTRPTDKPYKVGLVACKFWAEGKCRKGDNCTFRHDPL